MEGRIGMRIKNAARVIKKIARVILLTMKIQYATR